MTNKQMNIFRKYNTHILQTNPRHREEESRNTNSHKTAGKQRKATSQPSLPHHYDCKFGRTPRTEYQNKDQVQNPTNNGSNNNLGYNNNRTPQQTKPRLGLNACYWYLIFSINSVAVKTKTVLLTLGLPNYCKVSSQRNNLKPTKLVFTKRRLRSARISA